VCAGRVWHTVGKLSRRVTTLFRTSTRSEVKARSYERPKSQEFKLGQFRDSTLGVPGKKYRSDVGAAENHKEYYMGEGGGFPRVQVVMNQVSLRLPVACPNTKKVQNEF